MVQISTNMAPYYRGINRVTQRQPVFAGNANNGPLSVPLKDAELIGFDMEMTGFNPKQESIIQIAAIKYRFKNGQLQEVGSRIHFVNPHRELSPYTRRLTEIKQNEVDHGLEEKDALAELVRFMGPHPIILGHYPILDLEYLWRKLEQYGMHQEADRFKNDYIHHTIDVNALARRIHPEYAQIPPGYSEDLLSTENLPKVLGIDNTGKHQASNDVEITRKIFQKLMAQIPRQEHLTWDSPVKDLLGYQGPIATGRICKHIANTGLDIA